MCTCGTCQLPVVYPYTTGIVLAYVARRGGVHVSSGLLTHFGSTLAPITALVHAHVPLLILCPYEVRAAVVYLLFKP